MDRPTISSFPSIYIYIHIYISRLRDIAIPYLFSSAAFCFSTGDEISFDNIPSYIFARCSTLPRFLFLSADFISRGFCFISSLSPFLTSYRIFFPVPLFVTVSRTNAFSRVDTVLFVFSHSRPFPIHILSLLPLSFSFVFFNLFLFPFSFYLTQFLPSCTAPSDFFSPFFFFPPSPSRQNLRSLFISVVSIFPTRSTLTPLFVHSASYAPSLPLLYLFPGVL